MKQNQTLVAAIVLVLLGGLYWLTQTGDVNTKKVDTDFYQFDKGSVDAIEIVTEGNSHQFTRNGQDWLLDDYPADTSRMSRFLDTFGELEADRVISSNPEKHAKYEVADTHTKIRFLSKGDPVAQLIIGKQGANFQETFVRAVAEDKIHAVRAPLSSYRDFKTRDYWNKSVADISVDMIAQASFSGEHNYVLTREGPVWSYNGEQVDFEKVQNLLRPLETMRASNFIEGIPEDKELFQEIDLILETGEEVLLSFYLKDPDASVLLLSSSARSKQFEYPKSSLNRFKKSIEDLKADLAE